ncbi:putative DUF1963 family protein [Corynebacterium mustelae]|uniref:Putative DUF1963 family protein n=1 Tax=Corynebacterium mustelae TaxID=571915 RepID=A0A0G3GU71_9CORY|nr:DUF1963 domain-containing protein [Corynebacterium mustelae]AKK04659.1 putative DUF1963 family protein [Corynebacterium mustelae]
MYQSKEEIYQAIEAVGIEKFTERTDIIIKHTKECLGFAIADPQPDEIPIGASHIGGDPDLPEDFNWPTTSDGQPLTFLFQIDTTPLEPGMIAVFAGREITMVDIPHHVEFIAPNTPLVRTPQPDNLNKPHFYEDDSELGRSFFEIPLLLESYKRLNIPEDCSNAFREVIGEDEEWYEEYEALAINEPQDSDFIIQFRGNHVSYTLDDAAEDACEYYEFPKSEATNWINLVTLFSYRGYCICDAGVFQIVQYQGKEKTGLTHAAVQSS